MSLINTLKIDKAYEELKGGNLEVLNQVDPLSKIKLCFQLQEEFGVPEEAQSEGSVEEAFTQLLQRQKENEDHNAKMRKEHFERLAKAEVERLKSRINY